MADNVGNLLGLQIATLSIYNGGYIISSWLVWENPAVPISKGPLMLGHAFVIAMLLLPSYFRLTMSRELCFHQPFIGCSSQLHPLNIIYKMMHF